MGLGHPHLIHIRVVHDYKYGLCIIKKFDRVSQLALIRIKQLPVSADRWQNGSQKVGHVSIHLFFQNSLSLTEDSGISESGDNDNEETILVTTS